MNRISSGSNMVSGNYRIVSIWLFQIIFSVSEIDPPNSEWSPPGHRYVNGDFGKGFEIFKRRGYLRGYLRWLRKLRKWPESLLFKKITANLRLIAVALLFALFVPLICDPLPALPLGRSSVVCSDLIVWFLWHFICKSLHVWLIIATNNWTFTRQWYSSPVY